jgi:two-component sensor histidine kinase
VATLEELVKEHSDLEDQEREQLSNLIAEWMLLADLSFSDLLLWIPKWNEGGFICVAQIRPVTAATSVSHDRVGDFQARGRSIAVDRAEQQKQIIEHQGITAIPIIKSNKCIAIIERFPSSRQQGTLTDAYLNSADKLFEMARECEFPPHNAISTTTSPPRVGDGVLLIDNLGVVQYASPNAISAYRRLGMATNLAGVNLAATTVSLLKKPGVVDEVVTLIARGEAAGGAEVENKTATITLRSYPLIKSGIKDGALVLVRDVTELRRRDKALLTKESALREAHHRVKNNLQTVAALLRMQARRSSPETKRALSEAERRIGVIALVHETLTLEPTSQINFNLIADRLIALTLELAEPQTQIVRSGDFGDCDADISVPLAAALSELLQNAIEHGLSPNLITLDVSQDLEQLVVVVKNKTNSKLDVIEGLGLSIVRSLIEDELGGDVLVVSKDLEFRTHLNVPLQK